MFRFLNKLNFENSCFIFLSILLSIAVLKDGLLAILLAAVLMFLVVFMQSRLAILKVFILVLPFHYSPYLSSDFLGIPGAKIVNILGFFLFLALLHFGRSNPELGVPERKFRKHVYFVFAVYITWFVFMVFRSLDYFALLRSVSIDKFGDSELHYLLSYLIRPFIYLLPVFFVVHIVRRRKEIDSIVKCICFAYFLLSSFVLFVSLILNSSRFIDKYYMTSVWSDWLGIHYNTIGTVYLSFSSVLFYRAIVGSLFDRFNFLIAICSVLVIQSRSTYFLFPVSCIIVLLFLKNINGIIAFVISTSLIISFLLPEFVVQRLSFGVGGGTADTVLAGRVESMWIPLVGESFSSLYKFFFGAGRFSMVASPLYQRGLVYQAYHPHNAFIEVFIDGGIISLCLLLFGVLYCLSSSVAWGVKLRSPLYWSMLSSVIVYLLAMLTERTVYPSIQNMVLYLVIALMISKVSLFIGEISNLRG